MKIQNQKPTILDCIYIPKASGDFNPQKYIEKTITDKLYEPQNPGTPVTITDDNNNPISKDDITNEIACCMTNKTNIDAENNIRNIFSQTLTYYDKNPSYLINDTFGIQATLKSRLPLHNPTCIYTATQDIIPTCKEFLLDMCNKDTLFSVFYNYKQLKILGFYFKNDLKFEKFKLWLNNQTQTLISASILPMDTIQLLKDFQNLKLEGLSESLLLKKNDTDASEEYSFPRILMYYLMQYTKITSEKEFGCMPFNLGELYNPKAIVFVNIDQHAHTTAKCVNNEWDLINTSLKTKIRVLSNQKITKLTAATQQAQKIAKSMSAMQQNNYKPAHKINQIPFKTSAPTYYYLTKKILKQIKKMGHSNQSQNTYKQTKMTFAKPNRRNPDDFNKQGKMISTKYKPDLHIYLDTSGSISEENYKEAMQACIKLAKKLNINLYFNSFSHVMSQSTLLKTKDKSLKQIYAQFYKTQKVTGGTDYAQIWEYINLSKKRQRELSIIMTDFEYYAPTEYIAHPQNLYYIPISNTNWNWIVTSAKDFCKSMLHIEPHIRKHLLF